MSFPNHIGQKASDIHRLLTRKRLELYRQILREKLTDKDRAAEQLNGAHPFSQMRCPKCRIDPRQLPY
jgi:hypothetical protein